MKVYVSRTKGRQNLSILSQGCNFAVCNRVMMQHNRSSMFAMCQLSACRSSSICTILSSSFCSGARDGCSVLMGQTSTSLLPHPFSEIHIYPSSWMRYPPVCATPANALVMSSEDTPFALRGCCKIHHANRFSNRRIILINWLLVLQLLLTYCNIRSNSLPKPA